MKKSLVSLAVLAVLAAFAGTASAQTNVTIYGIADAGISYSDNGAATNNKTWALGSGLQSGSRLGFKGSEDLGGGLSAIFTLENGFNIDDGTLGQGNRLFGRQAFVGLSSNGIGTFKFGRQYNPIRPAVESIDPFALGLAGNAGNLLALYGERSDNTVNFTTANFSGFTGQIAYTFGEQAGSFPRGRQWGLSAGYANGPLNVVLAYHNQNKLTTATPPADNGNAKTTLLGGTYDFGVAKAHLAYASDTASGATRADNRDWLLGVSAPVGGDGTILASYIRKDDRIGANDAKQWALGYTHALSKRTNLYTSYGRIDNETANDTKTFNVGVRHKF